MPPSHTGLNRFWIIFRRLITLRGVDDRRWWFQFFFLLFFFVGKRFILNLKMITFETFVKRWSVTNNNNSGKYTISTAWNLYFFIAATTFMSNDVILIGKTCQCTLHMHSLSYSFIFLCISTVQYSTVLRDSTVQYCVTAHSLFDGRKKKNVHWSFTYKLKQNIYSECDGCDVAIRIQIMGFDVEMFGKCLIVCTWWM